MLHKEVHYSYNERKGKIYSLIFSRYGKLVVSTFFRCTKNLNMRIYTKLRQLIWNEELRKYSYMIQVTDERLKEKETEAAPRLQHCR
jgi:hypothetical protein